MSAPLGPSTLPALAVHEHPSLTARLTAGDAVRGEVVILPIDASPGDAATALLPTGERAAVVTEGGDAVGVVTIDDLIGALTERLEREAAPGITRILIAVSLSAPARRRPSTLDTGLALARRHRATTTLLHVMPAVWRRVAAGLPAGVEADVNRWRLTAARQALAALAPSDAPMPVRVEVRAGHIVEGVLTAAAEAHADLIVVG